MKVNSSNVKKIKRDASEKRLTFCHNEIALVTFIIF